MLRHVWIATHHILHKNGWTEKYIWVSSLQLRWQRPAALIGCKSRTRSVAGKTATFTSLAQVGRHIGR